MRSVLPVAIAAAVLAACSSTAGPVASDARVAARPSATASAGPLAVVVNLGPDNNYAVYLVGLDGRPVATAHATVPPPITTWVAASPIGNLWATYATASNRRAYYLDGGTSVRFLDPDGTTGEVARVDANNSTRSFFAVSPDDSRIAVSVFDYSTPPTVHMYFYVQDIGGGPREMIAGPANTFFYPIGWHDGRVVAQAGRPYQAIPETLYGAYPDEAADFLLIDPNGRDLATVGGAACAPVPSLATPAGIVCLDANTQKFTVLGWDGSATSFSGAAGTGGASLSTDGMRVATSDAGELLISQAASAAPVRTGKQGFPGEAGWLDPTHVAYRINGSPREAIYDTGSGSTAPIAVDGKVVARLPGGL